MNQKLVIAVVAALMTGKAPAEEVDITFTGYILAAQVGGSFPSAPSGDMPVTLTLRSSREIFQFTTVNTAIPDSQARLTSGDFITEGSWNVGGITGSAPNEPLGSSATGGKFNVLAYDNFADGTNDKIVGFAADLSTALLDGRTLKSIEFDLAPVYDIFQWSTNGNSTTATLQDIQWSGLTGTLKVTHTGSTGITAHNTLMSSITVTPVVVDGPPTANSGADFSVNEGQTGVMLDGSASSDPDGDTLTYAWTQLAGTSVTLSDAAAAQPTFDAPLVALGGETFTFALTVTANGESSIDTVGVTVVNVNHPPVADAGDDQSIAEGSPVTLLGGDSFDVDNDTFTYSWVQTGGSPTVTLSGANTANPTFSAPVVAAGGAPGVVATLVFELTVDDGFPLDVPAPGYSFADSVDSVTVEVTNLNNDPTANAGADQTADENTAVALNGSGSSDPDSDPLTYAWSQIGGSQVALSGAGTAMASFTAPFVSPGGEAFAFRLTVDDGYGGIATDDVVVNGKNINDPPDASLAQPTLGTLWPPNHKLVAIGITGVSDPNSNATITIDSVFQDEPIKGTGDGDTPIDAIINNDGTVLLRAERSGNGDGRVYHIHFTASDLEGSASGVVAVSVPKKKKASAVDGGELHDSTQ